MLRQYVFHLWTAKPNRNISELEWMKEVFQLLLFASKIYNNKFKKREHEAKIYNSSPSSS